MAGGEVGIERDEHLERAWVAAVVDDQLAEGEGEGEKARSDEDGDQDCVPEHLAAWKGGGGQPEDEEEDGEGGDEGDSVDGEADHVLAHAEHDEVLW